MIQTSGNITVWLDTQLDDSLIAEGRAREFVNRIQKLRKDLGFEVTDRIRVGYQCPPELSAAIEGCKVYIIEEILAQTLDPHPGPAEWSSEQEIDGHAVKIRIDRI